MVDPVILYKASDFYVLDKPAGLSTHSPDAGKTQGFIETAQTLLNEKLWVVHRLDKDTSGCLIVARTKEAAARWLKVFESGEVRKTYHFISPNSSTQTEFKVGGRIEKSRGAFILIEEKNCWETETHFKRLSQEKGFTCYEARPITGKPHQIRLHAENHGIPLLGDPEHGGEIHLRVFLHASRLEFDSTHVESPLPELFKYPELPPQSLQAQALHRLDQLRFLRNFRANTTAWRILGDPSPVRVELLEGVAQVLNYSENDLPAKDLEALRETLRADYIFERRMVNRGKMPDEASNIVHQSKSLPEFWQVTEELAVFEVRTNQGKSSGLFLDQRLNRAQIRHLSPGMSVCNLFSYSCGFSVMAALGGANEVVSVDSSSAALEWGKKNFELNSLKPNDFEFYTADALFWLTATAKKKRKFDILICDPPSFSRSKEGNWKIETDLKELLEKCLAVLKPGGTFLFTSNHEKLLQKKIERDLLLSAEKVGVKIKSVQSVRCDLDYDWPGTRAHLLGFWSVLHG